MHHFYAFLHRMRHIRRWSLMRNAQSENLAEHTTDVAILAHALALIRRDILGLPCNPDAVAAQALYHDIAETITGDLPTPVKYANPRIKNAFSELEDAARERLLSMLPDILKPEYTRLIKTEESEYYPLIKAADRLSAYIKCANELKSGNREFSAAYENTRQALDAMEMLEVSYFMEHFMPSYALDMDEMR